jgi:hypothetical protein
MADLLAINTPMDLRVAMLNKPTIRGQDWS